MSNLLSEFSELRKDPLVERWVIIAASRGKRPSDFAGEPEAEKSAGCPFCDGNETKTPPEIWAIRAAGTGPDTPGWDVRVVQNKFPALTIEADLHRSGIGLTDRMGGFGAHEVIIETPTHEMDLAVAPLEHIQKVVRAYRQRVLDLRRDDRFRHIVIFRNFGSAAGASLSHPHSQLIALPIVPMLVKSLLTSAKEHYSRKERCIFCDLIEQEIAIPDRLVLENQDFLVLSPFAARGPFELQIFPRRHMHDFTLMSEHEQWAFADILKQTLMLYREVLNNPPYNMMLQTAPSAVARPGHPEYWGTIRYDYHWHVELMPRLTKQAGFEWATGFYINPVSPELAKAHLRGEIEEPKAATA
jgi:UDPglucose--hexose-1-phosphate uridylyltransferase